MKYDANIMLHIAQDEHIGVWRPQLRSGNCYRPDPALLNYELKFLTMRVQLEQIAKG